jgi:AP-2 complex subunit beta-1
MACLSIPQLDVKKMVYLYLVTYASKDPAMTKEAVKKLIKDSQDTNPLMRALALRTMSNINVRYFYINEKV